MDIEAFFRDDGFQQVVMKVIAAQGDGSDALFEKCTDVCRNIRKHFPLRLKDEFDVYIVRGLWKTQFTSAQFRQSYSKKYSGILPDEISHEWLAFVRRGTPLDNDSIEAKHQFDPTCNQFTGEAWSYKGSRNDHRRQRYIGRVIKAELVDPAA